MDGLLFKLELSHVVSYSHCGVIDLAFDPSCVQVLDLNCSLSSAHKDAEGKHYVRPDFVSYLPFAWIGEQMMAISCGLQVGFTINFPEEPETAQHNLREIGPHVMFAPPRLYEQMTRNSSGQAPGRNLDQTQNL